MTRGDIVTARLRLAAVDAAAAQAIVSGDLGRFVAGADWPQDSTIDGLRLASAAGPGPACWLIELAGVVIGELGWKGGPGVDGTVEIGYGLAPAYRGRGYATEAVTGFVDWASRRPGVRRVVAETLADNVPSRRVLEKAGFDVDSTSGGYVYWLCSVS